MRERERGQKSAANITGWKIDDYIELILQLAARVAAHSPFIRSSCCIQLSLMALFILLALCVYVCALG
jgi:hypothetical protein